MDKVDQRTREVWLPLFCVALVAVAALAAVLLPTRMKHAPDETRVAPSRISAGVVTAPPLRSATQAMGSPAACSGCGVVENVIAVHGRSNGKVEAAGFLMSIRMDDGNVRTVEHRGALPAGSRVVVNGDEVRVLAAGT